MSTGTDVVKQLSFCHLLVVLQVVTPNQKVLFFTLNTIVKILIY